MANSDIRCSFSVDTPVGPITDKESARFALSHAVVFPIGGRESLRMVATDARVMSVTRHEGKSDQAYLVPGGALPSTGKVELNGEWRTTTGARKQKTTTTPAVSDDHHPGRFPAADAVMPEMTPDNCVALVIDAVMLAKLAKAISDDGKVTLLLPAECTIESAVGVVGSVGVGVIMPCFSDKDTRPVACRDYAAEAKHLRDHWHNVNAQIAPPAPKKS